jgi:hypothetical protein
VVIVSVAFAAAATFYQWFYTVRPYTFFHDQIQNLSNGLPIANSELQDGVYNNPATSYAQLPLTPQSNSQITVHDPANVTCAKVTANFKHMILNNRPNKVNVPPGPPVKNGTISYSQQVVCTGMITYGATQASQAGTATLEYTVRAQGRHDSQIFVVAIATQGATKRTNRLPGLPR